MKISPRNISVALCLLSLIIATPFATAQVVAQQASVPTSSAVPLGRPDVKIGDTFTYRKVDDWTKKVVEVFKHEVIEVTDDQIRVRRVGGSAPVVLTFTRDWNIVASGTSVFTPYFPGNQFPITKVGQSWKGKAREENKANGDRVDYTVQAKVDGIEQITVPAGTFQAVKIHIETRYNAYTRDGSGSGTMTETLWYTPEISRFIRYDYEDTSWSGQPYRKYHLELEKFERR